VAFVALPATQEYERIRRIKKDTTLCVYALCFVLLGVRVTKTLATAASFLEHKAHEVLHEAHKFFSL